MKILVCIKQVPNTTKVDIDEETGVLKRDGADTKLNPYDLFALETALWLKEERGGTVTALTMGPPQATAILKEAFMMGVDEGALLSDQAFAGSDVLATSYAMSQGISLMGDVDVIVCGKQTTDGDTAQVGPEIAEALDIPHATNVTKIIDVGDQGLRIEVEMGDSLELQDIPFPCLITVDADIFVPRLPSYKRKIATAQREIRTIKCSELPDQDPNRYGLSGSPTQVERIFPPESSTQKVMIKGTGDEAAVVFYEKLKELKFL
ncbi:MAG: electron transfer flavoprotein subunit beta/FixA family protein [Clostridiales Family XIII bacterium]|jgi:electron transfer flavoprotein beta subunit|nr:electron transfer flavoprotein subunit beta/FixA family protein [Clostridiales Family XIII bacterium]